MKAKRLFALLLLLGMLTVSFTACAETVRGNLEKRFSDIPTLEYEGKTYWLRSQLTTVLLMGVDRETGAVPEFQNYRSGGQADFLVLLVIDDRNDEIIPLQINRDTITDIITLSVLGEEIGTRKAQICLSHGFGDGGEQSCTLTVRAVSNLLYNVPITHFAALNMDAISDLNDALGGITVTLEDDFSVYDPAMQAGATLTLQGKQAEYYLRYRYGVGEQTNQSRLKRQRNYMNIAKETIMGRIQESSSFAGQLFDALEESMVTDMSRGYLVNMANKVRRYEVRDVMEIEGETTRAEDGYVEFYPYEDSIVRVLLEACFEEKK